MVNKILAVGLEPTTHREQILSLQCLPISPSEFNTKIMNHFIELKYRLSYLTISYLLITTICYVFAEELIYLIAKPLTSTVSNTEIENTKRLIYTNITEAFITQLKLSFYIGTYLILPNIMYSLWAFIKPGLYDNEKRFIKNTFIPSIILFILSIILSYNFLIPAIYKFFIGFETNFENSMISIELEAKISEYVSTILQTVVVMSLLSQYPIIILILMYLNIIDHKWLIGRRKLFIMSFFCLGALVTPPDVLSQIFLATILLVSYEFMLYTIILYRKYTS